MENNSVVSGRRIDELFLRCIIFKKQNPGRTFITAAAIDATPAEMDVLIESLTFTEQVNFEAKLG